LTTLLNVTVFGGLTTVAVLGRTFTVHTTTNALTTFWDTGFNIGDGGKVYIFIAITVCGLTTLTNLTVFGTGTTVTVLGAALTRGTFLTNIGTTISRVLLFLYVDIDGFGDPFGDPFDLLFHLFNGVRATNTIGSLTTGTTVIRTCTTVAALGTTVV